MKKFVATLLVLAVGFPACTGTESNNSANQSSDGVTVEFREIRNDIAYFDIRNGSAEDVQSLNLEISYLDGSGNLVKVDTVSYSMTAYTAGVTTPFLASGMETFIVQSIEPGTVKASARRID
jgi:hypothetical protein